MTLNQAGNTIYSEARVFVDANEKQQQSYWDYEQSVIEWGEPHNYEIVSKIGRGKYSEVFKGVCVSNDTACVIKVLKPVKLKKIYREIKILKNLMGGPHVIGLLDVIQDSDSKIPALIFESVDNVDFRILYPKFTKDDIKCYFSQLLTALNYAHSMGIIHRDVKPQNVMIDPRRRELKLIDWGLAEFYHRGVDLNVRVASRYHKGPELLINLQQYDYSLDLWSVGAMIAAIVFKREPFFKGDSNPDQLVKIARVLGVPDLLNYCQKYGIQLSREYDKLVQANFPRKQWTDFVNKDNEGLSNDETTVDLINSLLVYDHQKRLTAQEALDHPFFKEE